jgi:HEPN domain-containing protein
VDSLVNRAGDSFAQAKRDLQHAVKSRDQGSHEWSCFASHQAAEKAVTALHLRLGQEAWGHVITKLLRELPSGVPDDLVERGRTMRTTPRGLRPPVI